MAKFVGKSQTSQMASADVSGVIGGIVSPGVGIYAIRMNTATDNPLHSILQDVFGTLPTEMTPRSARIEDGHAVFTCEIERLPELGNVTFDLLVLPGAFIVKNAKGQKPHPVEPPVEAPAVQAPPVEMKERVHAEAEDGDEDLKTKFE